MSLCFDPACFKRPSLDAPCRPSAGRDTTSTPTSRTTSTAGFCKRVMTWTEPGPFRELWTKTRTPGTLPRQDQTGQKAEDSWCWWMCVFILYTWQMKADSGLSCFDWRTETGASLRLSITHSCFNHLVSPAGPTGPDSAAVTKDSNQKHF